VISSPYLFVLYRSNTVFFISSNKIVLHMCAFSSLFFFLIEEKKRIHRWIWNDRVWITLMMSSSAITATVHVEWIWKQIQNVLFICIAQKKFFTEQKNSNTKKERSSCNKLLHSILVFNSLILFLCVSW